MEHPNIVGAPKPVLILGAGRSGLGAALLLRHRQIPCLISDIKQPDALTVAICKQHGIELWIGPQTQKLLQNKSFVVCSPGIAQDIPILIQARSMGLTIKSEIDLALGSLEHPWIGVTGTNGKSTCTHWLAQILDACGHKAMAVGNIGKSPSEVLAQSNNPGSFVVELSSYQIESSAELKPYIVIFTSFSKDHLERHKTIENYFLAKWKLLDGIPDDGLFITNHAVYKTALAFGCKLPKCKIVLTYSKDDCDKVDTTIKNRVLLHETEQVFYLNQRLKRLKLPFSYEHLRQNAAMCLIAAHHLTRLDLFKLANCLEKVSSLPYRFEIVAHSNGYPIINDSKSTNVDSTLVAMKSLNQACYLLVGGRKKVESFKPLLVFKSKIKGLYVYGESKNEIAEELEKLKPIIKDRISDILPLIKLETMHSPAPILFSPACASFDQFENFEARGLYFNEQIKQIFQVEDQSSADST